jgi:predicted nucleotidyltransferase
MLTKLQSALKGCYEAARPEKLKECQVIYAFLSGSRAYGIAEEDSDYDIVCVFIAPKSFYLGLNSTAIPEAVELKDVKFTYQKKSCLAGIRYYELRHFITLALKCNPSILEGLWIDENDIIYHDNVFKDFRAARTLFLSSSKIFKAYTGYAYDQMKKMTAAEVSTGRMGAKRKELLEKFGYDTKNATHLIRMLYTAADIATGREIRVKMPENIDILKAIRKGQFALDEVLFMAAQLSDLAERKMLEREASRELLTANRETIEKILIKSLWEAFS